MTTQPKPNQAHDPGKPTLGKRGSRQRTRRAGTLSPSVHREVHEIPKQR